MNIIEALALGVVQGLTEFLPISSSGHLFLLETYFGFIPNLSFELALHVGTLTAVVIFFYKDIIALCVGFYTMLVERTVNDQGLLALKLGVATLLTFPTAYLMQQFVLVDTISLTLVGVTLLITAGLILVSEYVRPWHSHSLTWQVVVLLGLVQGFAVLPGISRSGITIALLLFLGVNRQLSARTSFLLSIPTIFGAGLVTYVGGIGAGQTMEVLPVVVGVVTSAVVGYAGIKWMMKLVEGQWIIFVPYCFMLGVGLLLCM